MHIPEHLNPTDKRRCHYLCVSWPYVLPVYVSLDGQLGPDAPAHNHQRAGISREQLAVYFVECRCRFIATRVGPREIMASLESIMCAPAQGMWT